MKNVLSPFEICSKIGIFSMLLLSLFADRENIQIFLALRERMWLGSCYSAFNEKEVQEKGDVAQYYVFNRFCLRKVLFII